MHSLCGAMFGEKRVNNFQGIGRLFSWSNLSVSYSYTLLLRLAVTDASMLLKLQSRTARLLSFRDEPTLRRFCTHCGPIFNRRSRVRAVVSRGSTGLVGQNTSCKAHKVCISLRPTGWDDVFCS